MHDEVLVELPAPKGFVEVAEAENVVAIMCRSMERVTGSVPVSCEYAHSACWSKEEKAIIPNGMLYPWKPAARVAAE